MRKINSEQNVEDHLRIVIQKISAEARLGREIWQRHVEKKLGTGIRKRTGEEKFGRDNRYQCIVKSKEFVLLLRS